MIVPANAVLTRAADWFERLQNEDMSVESIAAWQRWLEESPAHREAFDRCQTLWRQLDRVPAPKLPSRRELALDRDLSVPARWALAAGIAMIAMIGVVILATSIWTRNSATTVFETAAAEHQNAKLPDGSHLSLGAKSLVWIKFSGEQRTVILERGEAFFEVAKDKQRPFTVRAGSTMITALGTAFNVRKAGERVMVAVSEGAVRVAPQPKKAAAQLAAGQQLTVDRSEPISDAQPTNPETITAWRTGRLEYRGEPLKYVIADVNRYLKDEVAIVDPTAGDLLVTGTVYESDVDAWLSGLGEFLPVTVEKEGSRLVLRMKNR